MTTQPYDPAANALADGHLHMITQRNMPDVIAAIRARLEGSDHEHLTMQAVSTTGRSEVLITDPYVHTMGDEDLVFRIHAHTEDTETGLYFSPPMYPHDQFLISPDGLVFLNSKETGGHMTILRVWPSANSLPPESSASATE